MIMRAKDPVFLFRVVRRVEVVKKPVHVWRVPPVSVIPCELSIRANVDAGSVDVETLRCFAYELANSIYFARHGRDDGKFVGMLDGRGDGFKNGARRLAGSTAANVNAGFCVVRPWR